MFGRQTKGVYSPDLLQVADQNLMSLLQYGEKFLRDKIFANFAVGLTSAKINSRISTKAHSERDVIYVLSINAPGVNCVLVVQDNNQF